MKTPAERGFRMPAEWAPHCATWIAWPHQKRDWPGRFGPIPWIFTELVRLLAPRERVEILVRDAAEKSSASGALRKAGVNLGRVGFHRLPTDRCWTRDSGPTFVRKPSGGRMAVCWKFNAWAKYPNHKKDELVSEYVASAAGVPAHRPGVVMEGGAVDVDGKGTLLATEECLLSDVQARNPGMDRAEVERVLSGALGVRRVVWLGRGIAGDDTHGHIDDVARFAAPGRVLLCEEKDPKEENYAPLRENRERLRGAGLEVIPLPLPAPIVFDGMRVPASYANFYIANGLVIVPTFDDPMDRRALGLLAEVFPGREVVGLHAVDLIWGLGTVHCATQQEPA